MWLVQTMRRVCAGGGVPEDLDLLKDVCGNIAGRVLCALGDFATSPVTATIRNFRDEYLDFIRSGRSVDSWVPATESWTPAS